MIRSCLNWFFPVFKAPLRYGAKVVSFKEQKKYFSFLKHCDFRRSINTALLKKIIFVKNFQNSSKLSKKEKQLSELIPFLIISD
jgi:hypothetical protein